MALLIRIVAKCQSCSVLQVFVSGDTEPQLWICMVLSLSVLAKKKGAICFQDSPTNKLLYAKEIPEYKKRVQCYYQQIQDMPPLSEQEMNAHLAEESRVSKAFEKSLRGSCLV